MLQNHVQSFYSENMEDAMKVQQLPGCVEGHHKSVCCSFNLTNV